MPVVSGWGSTLPGVSTKKTNQREGRERNPKYKAIGQQPLPPLIAQQHTLLLVQALPQQPKVLLLLLMAMLVVVVVAGAQFWRSGLLWKNQRWWKTRKWWKNWGATKGGGLILGELVFTFSTKSWESWERRNKQLWHCLLSPVAVARC